jgi:hypothetical protein
MMAEGMRHHRLKPIQPPPRKLDVIDSKRRAPTNTMTVPENQPSSVSSSELIVLPCLSG